MAHDSTIGPRVDVYNVDKVSIGEHSTISQDCFICTASHDYLKLSALVSASLPLIVGPITIERYVWLTAHVAVCPGVTVGEGAVVTLGSVVQKTIEPWFVYEGVPATKKRPRDLR